jgi:WD40 repeat protein
MHELKGHKGIPKSTVMDLKGDYLVSAGTDGALIIWDLVEQPPAELARLNQIIETNGDMYIFMNEIDRSRPCDMSWNSTEHIVAVPSKNGEIKIVEKDTWSVRYTVKEPSNKVIWILSMVHSIDHCILRLESRWNFIGFFGFRRKSQSMERS